MSDQPKRLLLLINSLEGGGAEKVMADLAKGLAEHLQNVEIRLALLDDLSDSVPVDPSVKIVRLDSRGSMWRSVWLTRRLVAEWQPDVVLSFLTRANCAAVLARGPRPFRCVISERVNTSSHLSDGPRGLVLRRLVKWLYPRADAVVAVSQGVADELLRHYNVPAFRLSVIHNPIDIASLQAKAAETLATAVPRDFFVSVGRLVPNKGGEVLLHAFAKHRNRDRSLVILGEGPERVALRSLARDLGISDRLHLPGYVANPHAIVSRAKAYVSASRSEGFPNALLEAMALGRAVAATDCPSGPAEILAGRSDSSPDSVQHTQWGLLCPVDDVAALAVAMDRLDDPDVRKEYGQRAEQRAGAYAPARAIAAYADTLRLATSNKHQATDPVAAIA